MSTAASQSRRSTMTIGEVLDLLRPDFPDITISKIRFLESERLVEPERAPSGYRHFTSENVARLRYVLTAQRDHYLPLRVIRDHLDAIDRGLDPPLPIGRPAVPLSIVSEPGAPTSDSFRRDHADIRLSRAELQEAAGVSAELVDSLDEYGLITARQGLYDADALAVVRAAGELAGFGLEARHMRTFRNAADREVGLVEQVVTPMLRQRTNDARSRAEELAREIAAVSVRLHTALVRAGVRSALGR